LDGAAPGLILNRDKEAVKSCDDDAIVNVESSVLEDGTMVKDVMGALCTSADDSTFLE
jgi:hypothetical protein